MPRRPTIALVALLQVGPAGALASQTPGTAVSQALRSLTGGFGGCRGAPDQRDTTLAVFGSVRFVMGTCVLEHGDSATAIVGLDRDSVLYLLESKEAFNFFLARHPLARIDSSNALPYARLLLAMSGHNGLMLRAVNPGDSLPSPVRHLLALEHEKSALVMSQAGGEAWIVFQIVKAPSELGPYYLWHEVFFTAKGYLMLVKDSLVYHP